MIDKYEYLTLRRCFDGSVDVLGWGTYPESSVLAGQASKTFLACFDTEEEARFAYPEAENFSSKFTEPQISYNHLPGDDEPNCGDDYVDGY